MVVRKLASSVILATILSLCIVVNFASATQGTIFVDRFSYNAGPFAGDGAATISPVGMVPEIGPNYILGNPTGGFPNLNMSVEVVNGRLVTISDGFSSRVAPYNFADSYVRANFSNWENTTDSIGVTFEFTVHNLSLWKQAVSPTSRFENQFYLSFQPGYALTGQRTCLTPIYDAVADGGANAIIYRRNSTGNNVALTSPLVEGETYVFNEVFNQTSVQCRVIVTGTFSNGTQTFDSGWYLPFAGSAAGFPAVSLTDYRGTNVSTGAVGVVGEYDNLHIFQVLPSASTTFDGATSDFTTGYLLDQPVLEKTSYGRVQWTGSKLAIYGPDFDTYATYAPNFISLDSANLPAAVNTSANVTLYGDYSTWTNPIVKKDGVTCADCTLFAYNSSGAYFNVSGFSNYTLENGTSATVINVTFDILNGTDFVDVSGNWVLQQVSSGCINYNVTGVSGSGISTNCSGGASIVNISVSQQFRDAGGFGDNFTLCFAKKSSEYDDGFVLFEVDPHGTGYVQYQEYNDGRFAAYLEDTDGDYVYTEPPADYMKKDGYWHHYCVVWSGGSTGDSIRYYRDGSFVARDEGADDVVGTMDAFSLMNISNDPRINGFNPIQIQPGFGPEGNEIAIDEVIVIPGVVLNDTGIAEIYNSYSWPPLPTTGTLNLTSCGLVLNSSQDLRIELQNNISSDAACIQFNAGTHSNVTVDCNGNAVILSDGDVFVYSANDAVYVNNFTIENCVVDSSALTSNWNGLFVDFEAGNAASLVVSQYRFNNMSGDYIYIKGLQQVGVPDVNISNTVMSGSVCLSSGSSMNQMNSLFLDANVWEDMHCSQNSGSCTGDYAIDYFSLNYRAVIVNNYFGSGLSAGPTLLCNDDHAGYNIFNNIFNGTYVGTTANTVFFNTTAQAGTNIIGGSQLGGNFWADPSGTGYSETCAGDGTFCTTPYDVFGDASAYDYLPLTSNNVTVASVVLVSPVNNTQVTTVDTDFTFNLTGGNGTETCTLFVDGVARNTSLSTADGVYAARASAYLISRNYDVYDHNWSVQCGVLNSTLLNFTVKDTSYPFMTYGCRAMDTVGTYSLQNDVSIGAVTCFNVSVSGSTFEGNGYTINQSGAGYVFRPHGALNRAMNAYRLNMFLDSGAIGFPYISGAGGAGFANSQFGYINATIYSGTKLFGTGTNYANAAGMVFNRFIVNMCGGDALWSYTGLVNDSLFLFNDTYCGATAGGYALRPSTTPVSVFTNNRFVRDGVGSSGYVVSNSCSGAYSFSNNVVEGLFSAAFAGGGTCVAHNVYNNNFTLYGGSLLSGAQRMTAYNNSFVNGAIVSNLGTGVFSDNVWVNGSLSSPGAETSNAQVQFLRNVFNGTTVSLSGGGTFNGYNLLLQGNTFTSSVSLTSARAAQTINVYNNIFADQSLVSFTKFSGSTFNINTTQAAGPNVVGSFASRVRASKFDGATSVFGGYLGGNYWMLPNGSGYSQTCSAGDVAGFCASQYAAGAVNDSLPLTLRYKVPVLENTSYAKVQWNGASLDFAGADFDSNVVMSPNFISVNSANLPADVNTSANVTLYGSYAGWTAPYVLKDGVACGASCTNVVINSSGAYFTVTGFSNYSVTNGTATLTLISPVNNTQVTTVDTDFTFNLTGGNGTETCTLTIDGSVRNTSVSTPDGVYSAKASAYLVSQNYDGNYHNWSVQCGPLNSTLLNFTVRDSAYNFWIDACPRTLDYAGEYVPSSSPLQCANVPSTPGITAGVNGVELDCRGGAVNFTSTYNGVQITGVSFVNVTNCTFTYNLGGVYNSMYVFNAMNVSITNNNFSGFNSGSSSNGIRIFGTSDGTVFEDNIVLNNGQYAVNGVGKFLRFDRNTLYGESVADFVDTARNNTVYNYSIYAGGFSFTGSRTGGDYSGNRFLGSAYLQFTGNMATYSPKVYNNLFNISGASGINYFIWATTNNASLKLNTTATNGTNIVGRSQFGGNYYGYTNGTGPSQTCLNSNNDSFCDSSFTLQAGMIDYLPLTLNEPVLAVTLTYPANNTQVSSVSSNFNFTTVLVNGTCDLVIDGASRNSTAVLADGAYTLRAPAFWIANNYDKLNHNWSVQCTQANSTMRNATVKDTAYPYIVKTLPRTLDTSGKYVMISNITMNYGTAFVGVDGGPHNVEADCAGYTIRNSTGLVYENQVNNVTVRNCIVPETTYCGPLCYWYMVYARYGSINLYNNTLAPGYGYGDWMNGASFNIVGNNFIGGQYAVHTIQGSGGGNFINNTLNGTLNNNIFIYNMTGNTIYTAGLQSCEYLGGVLYGVRIGENAANNVFNGPSSLAPYYSTTRIFNNIFNGTFTTCGPTGPSMNTTLTTGTNIVGGPYIGGNYYGNATNGGYSQTCYPGSTAGICANSYAINANFTDYLPLTQNTATVTLVSPANGSQVTTVDTNFTFNTSYVNATCDLMIDGVSRNSTAVYANTQYSLGARQFLIEHNYDGTTHNWSINCGAVVNSSTYKVTVKDTAYPYMVDSCRVLDAPGTYVLTQNVTGQYCLNVTAPNVSIDCRGYQVYASYPADVIGFYSGSSSTGSNYVKNCVLVGTHDIDFGPDASAPSFADLVIENVTFRSSGSGTQIGTGILMEGLNGNVQVRLSTFNMTSTFARAIQTGTQGSAQLKAYNNTFYIRYVGGSQTGDSTSILLVNNTMLDNPGTSGDAVWYDQNTVNSQKVTGYNNRLYVPWSVGLTGNYTVGTTLTYLNGDVNSVGGCYYAGNIYLYDNSTNTCTESSIKRGMCTPQQSGAGYDPYPLKTGTFNCAPITLTDPANGSQVTSVATNFTFNTTGQNGTTCSLYLDGVSQNSTSVSADASYSLTAPAFLIANNYDGFTHNWSVNCTQANSTTQQWTVRDTAYDYIVDSCRNMDQSGTYALTGNLTCPYPEQLGMGGSSITLDCKGYTVRATGGANAFAAAGSGGCPSAFNDVVKNCNFVGASASYMAYVYRANVDFLNNTFTGNATYHIKYTCNQGSTFNDNVVNFTASNGIGLEVGSNAIAMSRNIFNGSVQTAYPTVLANNTFYVGPELYPMDGANWTRNVFYSGAYIPSIDWQFGPNIYENFFNISSGEFISVGSSSNQAYAKLNTTQQAGTNIIGLPLLGGNYYGYTNGTGPSQTCYDYMRDGVCDSPYVHAFGGTDYLPLTQYRDCYGNLSQLVQPVNGSAFFGTNASFELSVAPFEIAEVSEGNTTIIALTNVSVNQTVTNISEGAHLYTMSSADVSGCSATYYQDVQITLVVTPNLTSQICAALTYPNENNLPTPAKIPVNFTVFAPIGFSGTTVDINLTYGAVTATADESNCIYVEPDSQHRNYSCNVTMNYWYDPGDYDLSIYVNADGVRWTSVQVNDSCGYGGILTYAFDVNAVQFPGAKPGTSNVEGTPKIPIVNTGNLDVYLYMTAYNLAGRTNGAATLAASHVKVGTNLTSAVTMQHSTQKPLNIIVPKQSSVNLTLWMSMPAAQHVQDYYAETPWELVGLQS